MKELFEDWLIKNLLIFENPVDSVYLIDSKSYLLIDHKDGKIIDSKFSLILSREEKQVLNEVDFISFLWGDKFYYTPSSKIKNPEFNILRYLGQISQESYPFLGVHGKYELLNGSKDYSEWCKKAKFLNIKTLGICEKNTLAGTLAFQIECKKNGVKSILGETISIKIDSDIYLGKVFAFNKQGWENILLINTEINVINPSKYITEERLLELTEGVIFVFHPAYFPFNEKKIEQYSKKFLQCYFQLDSCEYNNVETDKQFIIETNKYIKSSIKPVLINDAYYLEKEDYEIKSTLNMIGGERDLLSNNQWFKTDDESLILLRELFENESDFERVIITSIESLYIFEDICNFEIQTGVFKLPQYKMNKEELLRYKSNEELFFSIIEKAFEEKVVNRGLDFDLYSSRLEREIEVIQKGGFIDYFLILWDIICFCEQNDILTGLGRGCFLPGSRVLLKDGSTKLIEEVEVGDVLENYFNGATQVNKTWEYQVEEEIVELIFDNDTNIRCTKDHKIYTLTRGWVEADKLLESDEISFIN